MIRRLVGWFDDRLGTTRFVRTALNKVFPDHWSFMIGEIALYSFAILVLTGTFLTFFFSPSQHQVVYHGSYAALRGSQVSQAYESVVRLSFDVRAGLVIRQIHHWAALLFLAAIVLHVCRVFFTGGFRTPRELNWMVGVTLLLLAIANGFTGYSLPDDLLSGTGLRIAYSIVESVPFIGTWAASLLFGGEFGSSAIVSRLFVLHIMLVPALIGGLLVAHMAILWHQKHTQFPGPGRTQANVVGSRLWPRYAAKSVALLFSVFGVLALLGGLAQINPVWLYGPFDPSKVSTPAQPDWYIGWLEGALRLFPGWELRAWHHTLASVFFPGVLLPGITFLLLYAWPFLEARFTGNHRSHHLLDRPSERPVRTALGVATLSFYVVLFAAGANDVIALVLHVSVATVTGVFRVMVIVLPPLAALGGYRLCRDRVMVREFHLARHPVPPADLQPAGPPEHIAAVSGAKRDVGAGTRPGRRGPESALGLSASAVGGGLIGFVAGRRRGRRRVVVIRRRGHE